jgi:hypothetical protein
MPIDAMEFSGQRRKVFTRGSIGIAAPAILLFIALPSCLYAPRFLAYSDTPRKSDAVILFLGDEKGGRRKEALNLLQGGYAQYLLVLGYKAAYTFQGGVLKPVYMNLIGNIEFFSSFYPGNKILQAEKKQGAHKADFTHYCWENTHIEVLTALKMMEALGLETAMMVSSPFHMRRIRIITARVIAIPKGMNPGHIQVNNDPIGEHRLDSFAFIPTHFEKPLDKFWFMNIHNLINVPLEYAKIVWFTLYSHL